MEMSRSHKLETLWKVLYQYRYELIPCDHHEDAYMDGYIQVIPQHVYPDRVYLCDEEGLLKGKDINFTATEEMQYPVVGTILALDHKEWE